MRKLLTWCAGGIAGVILTLAIAVGAQVASAGGAFLPLSNYVIGANATWTWLNRSPWVIEGTTVDDNETTVTFAEPTGDRTLTVPDHTGTVTLGAFEVASGVVTLDGANPTPVTAATTGLSDITSCQVTLMSNATPGLDPIGFTLDTHDTQGALNIYAYRATSASNPTWVASTIAEPVRWLCVGIP